MLLPFKNWPLNVLVSLVEFEGSFYSVLRPQVRKLFIRSVVGGRWVVAFSRWVGGRWFYNNPIFVTVFAKLNQAIKACTRKVANISSCINKSEILLTENNETLISTDVFKMNPLGCDLMPDKTEQTNIHQHNGQE